MGAVCWAANPLESRRRRDSNITCLACGRRPLTRKLDSGGGATRTAPPRLGDDRVMSDKDMPGGSENPKELTLGWGKGAEVEESSRAEQIEPMLDTATIGSVKRRFP